MNTPLRIAIAGLGTVGAATVKLLMQNSEYLSVRAGRRLEVAAVSARDRRRNRGFDLTSVAWHDDPVSMAQQSDIDVVVELIGGSDGPAKQVCEAAITTGHDVVTANKALLAHHGNTLAREAEKKGVSLNYEAAVAAGIPIIKALREGLAANRIERVYGILNGTCNYILSAMRDTGRNFEDVLTDAQEFGYAEADPAMDVDGIDSAHKLALLSSLAFGCAVDFEGVYIEGVRHVSPVDIQFADELGYRIKLLGSSRLTKTGLEQRVHPCMIANSAPIATVEGVLNAIVSRGDVVTDTMHEGPGAGAGPTSSAVVADIIDLAQGRRSATFGIPVSQLAVWPSAPMEQHRGTYYVRLQVCDEPGVMADITSIFHDQKISIEAMIQRSQSQTNAVPVVLTTHECSEAAMQRTLAAIAKVDTVVERPCMIRIEPL
mgnify:CR=1 FL=1